MLDENVSPAADQPDSRAAGQPLLRVTTRVCCGESVLQARKPQARGGGEQQQPPVKCVCPALVRAARSSQNRRPIWSWDVKTLSWLRHFLSLTFAVEGTHGSFEPITFLQTLLTATCRSWTSIQCTKERVLALEKRCVDAVAHSNKQVWLELPATDRYGAEFYASN
eukprot:1160548-Pelagomonas_calceolata.AAC.12